MTNTLPLFVYTEVHNQAKKTLFLLHGTGGDEHDLLFLDEFLHQTYNLVGLRGNVIEHGMNRFFHRISEGVFDEVSIREEAKKLHEFFSFWMASHQLLPENTAWFGYSNGANMILAHILLYPEDVHQAVLLHPMLPLVPTHTMDLSDLHVFVGYGKNDVVITPEKSKEAISLLQSYGATVSSHEYPGGHQLSQKELEDAASYLMTV
jgi:phospholipase/carboxylesterase